MDRNRLALYSLAHFWVDSSCALLVFRTMAGREDLALCLLLYNFCAFALQMPLGLLAGPEPAERLAGWLDGLSTVAALGAGLFLAVFRGNYTLLLVAVWLLALLFRNISPFPRNKACQRGRKKVQ